MRLAWLLAVALAACGARGPTDIDAANYQSFLALGPGADAPLVMQRHDIDPTRRDGDYSAQCGLRIYDLSALDAVQLRALTSGPFAPANPDLDNAGVWRTSSELRTDPNDNGLPKLLRADSDALGQGFCHEPSASMETLRARISELWLRDDTLVLQNIRRIGGGVLFAGSGVVYTTYFAMIDAERHRAYALFTIDPIFNESTLYPEP